MIPPLVVVIIMIIFNIIVILPPFLSQMTAANVTVLYRLLSFIMIREPSAPA
jgi:multisubunit Na+/H+ antiporter MnhE subunit